MSVEYWNEQLIKSARDGNHSLLQESLDQGANINAKDTCKSTALIWAAHNGHHECTKILLEANANTTLKSTKGRTAYDHASK